MAHNLSNDVVEPWLPSLGHPHHHHCSCMPTNFEMLNEPVHYGPMNGPGFEPAGPFHGETKPVYEFLPRKLTPAQFKSFVEARVRVLLSQQNRVFPFQTKPGSGGTGVFHPRVVNNNSKPNASAASSFQKGQSGRNRQFQQDKIQVNGQRNNMKRVDVAVGKEEECYYYLPPEMGLPKDWTY